MPIGAMAREAGAPGGGPHRPPRAPGPGAAPSYTGVRSPAPARPIAPPRARPSRADEPPPAALPRANCPGQARSALLSRSAAPASTLAHGGEVKGERGAQH
ncbi:uncharacterized protein LOC112678481 [Canis lupus dingo]|uniref:uncharacterized protein LOC112678481 n=1 Tax=Canis lupus dingo TaxID=286419 RepID=UPI0020C35C1E|nr:uncharacterized protein LOC112678481 [Canis lupus dingo]